MIIKTEKLQNVCSKILPAIDTTNASIISENLQIKTVNNKLILSVTNNEYLVEVTVDDDVTEEFNATIRAELFLKLVTRTTTEDIEMYISERYLKVNADGFYTIPLIYTDDTDELVELPKIEIKNVTNTFNISSNTLKSILTYNSKEITKSIVSKPVQRLYYMDEKGAITFSTGACVNKFTLEKPVRLLLNGKVVKLFKLFDAENVKFTLGYDSLSNDIIQTKIRLEDGIVTLTAILNCDDSLLKSVPVNAIRSRAETIYNYSISVNKDILLQALNRLSIFSESKQLATKPYFKFTFTEDKIIITDDKNEFTEKVKYNNAAVGCDYSTYLTLMDVILTLENSEDSNVTINFGNEQAVVIVKNNIVNVIPEVHI